MCWLQRTVHTEESQRQLGPGKCTQGPGRAGRVMPLALSLALASSAIHTGTRTFPWGTRHRLSGSGSGEAWVEEARVPSTMGVPLL